MTILFFGCGNPDLFEQFNLGKAKTLKSDEVVKYLDWKDAKSPVFKICVERSIDADTMNVLAETEIHQTITLVPGGVNVANEHDTRSYVLK